MTATEANRRYREKNRAKFRAKSREWYERNKESAKETVKRCRLENADHYKDYCKQYREANKEKIKQYREENKEKIKQWREENKEALKEKAKEYRKANRGKIAHQSRRRQLKKLNAVPHWITEKDIKLMDAIYQKAAEMTEATGEKYVVDHYYPIRGKDVCGLHTPNNLQVITDIENKRKYNNSPTIQTITTKTTNPHK